MQRTKNYREKQQLIDEFIAKNDPYKKDDPLKFDLRKYQAYIKTHDLKPEDITPEILTRFEIS